MVVPIVVVLTMVDLLDRKLLQTLRSQGIAFKSVEEAQSELEPRRKQFLEQYCMQPLQRAAAAAGGDGVIPMIPCVAVSSMYSMLH